MNPTLARATGCALLAAGLLGTTSSSWADAGAQSPGGLGCIMRDASGIQLIRPDSLTREDLDNAARDARTRAGNKAVDPCYFNKGPKMPGAVFASLARQHPATYRAAAPQKQPPPRHSGPNPTQPLYNFVNLDGSFAPYVVTIPAYLDNKGRIYATGWLVDANGEFTTSDALVLKDGRIQKTSPNGYVMAANEDGTAVGFIFLDYAQGLVQAAIFEGNKTTVLPLRPGEVSSYAADVNAAGDMLVWSFDQAFAYSFWLFERGQWLPINLDTAPGEVQSMYLGKRGEVIGTVLFDTGDVRGYRFNPHTQEFQVLAPVYPADQETQVDGVNTKGEALGYSYVFSQTEHIGFWGVDGTFTTYFTEGTPQYPTISSALVASDNHIIGVYGVAQPPEEVGNIYVIPKPGVRFNLLDFMSVSVEHGPPWGLLGINNDGNIIGITTDGTNFFLQRVRSLPDR